MAPRLYDYVGPRRLLDGLDPAGATPLRSADDLARWLARNPEALTDAATFVVDAEGWLRLAPRRSEHVACAGGRPVLAAGEIAFARRRGRLAVGWATNQSTGYCPEPSSFAALAAALGRIHMEAPGDYETRFEFRRCEGCGQINLVKDDDWRCGACGQALPARWNFVPPPPPDATM